MVSFVGPALAGAGALAPPAPLLVDTVAGGAGAHGAAAPVKASTTGAGRCCLSAHGHTEALPLNSTHAEEVASLLKQRLPAATLVGLEKVYNRPQMRRFAAEREIAAERGPPNDLLLWHGTRGVSTRDIALGPDGLDLRVGERDDCLFGRALYFADSPLYSSHFGHVVTDASTLADARAVVASHVASDDDDARLDDDDGGAGRADVNPDRVCVVQLLLCQVLAGAVKDYGTATEPSLRKPPTGFDSVSGTTHHAGGSRMWAIHNNAQCYTAYVVTVALPVPEVSASARPVTK